MTDKILDIKDTLIGRYLDELMVAIGSIIISFSAVFVRIVDTPPTVTGFYRMAIGGAILIGYAAATRRQLFTKPHLMFLMFMAGLWVSLDLAFWHNSIHRIGPGLATVLGNCQVFLLTIVGIVFFHERVKKTFLYAIPTAAIGLYCLVGHKWGDVTPGYRIGVMQGLATAVFYALCTVTMKQTRTAIERLDPVANLAWISIASAFCLAILSYLQNESFAIHSARTFEYLLCYGVFSQVVGWFLITRALAKVNLSTAGFLILLQPSLSFIWDILLFGRPTPPIELAGTLITMVAIYISVTSQKKKF